MSIQKLIGHIFLIGRRFNYKFETGVRTQITNNYRYQNKKTLGTPAQVSGTPMKTAKNMAATTITCLKRLKGVKTATPGFSRKLRICLLFVSAHVKKLKTSGQNITIITYSYIYIYIHVIMIIIIINNSNK